MKHFYNFQSICVRCVHGIPCLLLHITTKLKNVHVLYMYICSCRTVTPREIGVDGPYVFHGATFLQLVSLLPISSQAMITNTHVFNE